MAREVWAGVMFHILFSVLSTMLVDGVYLELSENPSSAQAVNNPLHGCHLATDLFG